MAAAVPHGYPPFDVPKPVALDLWVVDAEPMRVMGAAVPVRMTVIRLSDGGLWLHSPTRCGPEVLAVLEAMGPVRHLVAPNVAHWTYLKGWQDACPETITWAAPNLRRRLQVRLSRVRLDCDLGDAPPPEWAGEFDQVVIPGGAGLPGGGLRAPGEPHGHPDRPRAQPRGRARARGDAGLRARDGYAGASRLTPRATCGP